MPLEERVLQPIYVSRDIIDENKKDIYNQLPNELECFTNETLANIIKQLSSLSMYAEDLFASILQDASNLIQRTNTLQIKVNNLAVKVTQLDSTNEDVSLHDIHRKKPYKPQNTTVQEIFSKKTIPKSILELYYQCSKPPPLNLLNQFREDGKDSMKFYTNPSFFFELWRDAMLRQVEKEKNNKKLHHRLSNKMQNGLVDAKERKPRQPANSNERYRKMVSQQEFMVDDEIPNRNVIYMSNNEVHYEQQYDSIRQINGNQPMDIYATYNGNAMNQQQMQQHYGYHNGNQNTNNSLNQQHYYGTIKNGNVNYPHQMNGDYAESNLIQNNMNNCSKHNAYPNGIHQQHLFNQQMNGNYNSITPPPSYPNSQQFNNQQDQYNQMQQNHMQTLSRRSNSAIRPSQPPPQPPQLNGSQNSSINQNEYHQTNGYTTHYSQSNHAQHHPNSLSSSSNSTNLAHSSNIPNMNNQMQQANQSDLPLPPPMPINLNGKLVSSTSTVAAQSAAQQPQIPPPPPMPNPNIYNDNTQPDVTDNSKIKVSTNNNTSVNKSPVFKGTSFEQEILQKQKQLQPIKHINRPPPKTDPRNDLLAAIREGIKLRKVEESIQKETVEQSKLLDVASILARRVAMALSDSESNESENSDNDEWDDESHV